jgi:conjugation system TraG family ATPase
MTKKKGFDLPYIGEDQHKFATQYTQNGDYSVVIQFDNPIPEYAADTEAYYNFHQLFSGIIKIVGSGHTLQKLDVILTKEYKGEVYKDFLSRKYVENFAGRLFKRVSTYLTVTRNVKRGTFFVASEKEFEDFERTVSKVVDQLNSKGLNARTLKLDELLVLRKRILAFNFNEEKFSINNLNCHPDKIQLGEKVIKNFSLIDIDEINLPGTVKPYRELQDLGVDFPVDLLSFLINVPHCPQIIYNQVIQIPDQHKILGSLQRKKQRHQSMPDPANDLSIKDIEALQEDVAQNNQLVIYSHFNVCLQSSNEHIEMAANFLESELFTVGITPGKNAYNQLELFKACFPGCSNELKEYDKFLSTSEAVICLLFKEKLSGDEDSSFQLFFCDRQGVPVKIDINDKPMETGRINNRNKFVLGPSGSGKSFFVNHLVRQYIAQNTDVVLVDTGHSYSGICHYYQGKYITYEENRPITMNPFLITREEYNEEKREFLKALIGLIWKGNEGNLSQMEDTVIANVIEQYYREHFSPESTMHELSFNSFYDFSIHQIQQIMEEEVIPFDLTSYRFILKRFYRGGAFESILNEDIDASLFDEAFIVFEIDAIKEHKVLFPITTLIIMDVFLQKMRHKKSRKALIIEEAWKAIASPMMANYILYLYKTVRKFWGECAVVTQELDDIISNEIVKESILANSDTLCLLDQSKFKANYDKVSRLLAITEVEKRKIFTINQLDNKQGRGRFKEVYIRRGMTGEVYGVEVSIYEYLTYTTERSEKEAIKVYVEKCNGQFIEGLNRFVADLKKSGLSLGDFVSRINEHQRLIA